MTLNTTNSDILIAGAFAAFTVDLLVYPLDTLKTRIQSPQYAALYKSRANRGALFGGLYQGVGSVIVATIPSSGAFFTTYEGMKNILSPLSSSTPGPIALPTSILHSCASGIAEMVSCAILTPAEVIKQNAQVVNNTSTPSSSSSSSWPTGRSRAWLSSHSTTVRVLQRLRAHPTRLWSGYVALVARNLPSTGLQFPLYEALKARMTEWTRKRNAGGGGAGGSGRDGGGQPCPAAGFGADILSHACVTACSAGIAGGVAATATTPVDVLKTRIMLGAGDERESGGKDGQQSASSWARRKTDTTLWSVGKDVYGKEGVRGLFRGGALRAGWTAVGLGLYLGSYEGGRKFLESRKESKRVDGEASY